MGSLTWWLCVPTQISCWTLTLCWKWALVGGDWLMAVVSNGLAKSPPSAVLVTVLLRSGCLEVHGTFPFQPCEGMPASSSPSTLIVSFPRCRSLYSPQNCMPIKPFFPYYPASGSSFIVVEEQYSSQDQQCFPSTQWPTRSHTLAGFLKPLPEHWGCFGDTNSPSLANQMGHPISLLPPLRETPPLKWPLPGASFSSSKAEYSLHFPSSEQVNILSLSFHLPSSLKKISYAFYFPNTHTRKRSAVRAGALAFPDLSLALKH